MHAQDYSAQGVCFYPQIRLDLDWAVESKFKTIPFIFEDDAARALLYQCLRRQLKKRFVCLLLVTAMAIAVQQQQRQQKKDWRDKSWLEPGKALTLFL